MDYPFLIDKTSVELFRFIVDSGDNDQISQSLKDMVSDRQATSKEIDQVQGSINLIDKEIENYKAQVEAAKPILETCNKILELQNKVSRYNLACETRLQLLKIKQDKSNLSENYNNMTGLVVGEIYRKNGEWKFNAIGQPVREASRITAFVNMYA